MARTYLERQRKLWPNFAAKGILPKPSENIIKLMIADFQDRHRTGNVDLSPIKPLLESGQKLGGNYNRFSAENSNPKSVLDQMVNCLNKAAAEDRFIPWEFVFADYSVSGLDSSRQGYSSFKQVIGNPDLRLESIYIDDFTRASREELEWW